jgi:hypothetical protein
MRIGGVEVGSSATTFFGTPTSDPRMTMPNKSLQATGAAPSDFDGEGDSLLPGFGVSGIAGEDRQSE